MEITELYLLFRSKKAWYSILLYRRTKNTINSAQPLQLNSTTCGKAGGLKKARIIHSNACRKSVGIETPVAATWGFMGTL